MTALLDSKDSDCVTVIEILMELCWMVYYFSNFVMSRYLIRQLKEGFYLVPSLKVQSSMVGRHDVRLLVTSGLIK